MKKLQQSFKVNNKMEINDVKESDEMVDNLFNYECEYGYFIFFLT